jgi:hypothetical protein
MIRSSTWGRALGVAVLLGALGAPLFACGGSHAAAEVQDAGPIEECEAFVASYQSCLGSLGPADIAQARAEQTRAGLAAQATRGPEARAALREKCVANLSRLRTTCR